MPNPGEEILAEHLALLDAVAVVADAVGTQSVATATLTKLQFANPDIYDLEDMHDPAVNNTRLNILTPGWYFFLPDVVWSGGSSVGERTIYLQRTRAGLTTYLPFGITAAACPTNQTQHGLPAFDQALVGDYYEVQVYQTSGSARTITNAHFAAVWIGQ